MRAKLLKIFASPYFWGLILTAFSTYITFTYYNSKGQVFNRSAWAPVLDVIQGLDQKSLDLRLNFRGARRGSPQVALLAVDEKSVRTGGRWPWPREKIAKGIQNAVKHGAKVLAFDMIFSEPSANEAKQYFNVLKDNQVVDSQVLTKIEKELTRFDGDSVLAQTVKEHSDKIVLGTFFEGTIEAFRSRSYENTCYNLIFENSSAYKIWDQEQVLLGINDEYQLPFPDLIADAYRAHLQVLDEEVRKTMPPARNTVEEDVIAQKVYSNLLGYCSRFLNPEKDEIFAILAENWEAIRNEDLDLSKYATFNDWAEYYKSASLPSSILVADQWVMNTQQISAGAVNTAYFNALQDNDGTIRRGRLVVRSGYHYMPSVALKAFLVANDYNANVFIEADPKTNYQTKKIARLVVTSNETGEDVFEIPVDGEGTLLINYAGGQRMFEHASMGDLLSDTNEISVSQTIYDTQLTIERVLTKQVPKDEFFKDKIFIVGATAMGIYDLRVTPFDENFPGAETHVNIIDNLVRQDFLKRHPSEEVYMLGAVLALGLIFSFALSYLGALSGILMTLLTFTGVIAFDFYYLLKSGWVVTIVFPVGLISGLYVFLTFYKYLTEERNKKELRGTFAKYVSPSIVNEILENPENVELGGRKENITVFFSDVRGFTTISEKLDPRALVDLLNSYLTPMTELIFKNKGTLDKYMGDAIMAFFGAPIRFPDHAAWACRSALQQLVKLKELQAEYIKNNLPAIDMGIGLNSGEASVGNMGSTMVRNYTVMGDTVNLASRLEGITKQYGVKIIISYSTYEHIKDKFTCREVDQVKVKGKLEPVKIYELICEGMPDEKTKTMLEHFSRAYQLYYKKQWDESIAACNEALKINPEDGPSKVYIERCEEFKLEPPPENWDGVFVMKTK